LRDFLALLGPFPENEKLLPLLLVFLALFDPFPEDYELLSLPLVLLALLGPFSKNNELFSLPLVFILLFLNFLVALRFCLQNKDCLSGLEHLAEDAVEPSFVKIIVLLVHNSFDPAAVWGWGWSSHVKKLLQNHLEVIMGGH